MTSSERYSASSWRVADGSLLDPQIWINMIIICGGHKEISCLNFKTMFRDRMLRFQRRSLSRVKKYFPSVKHALKIEVCILRYAYETVLELQGKNRLKISSGCFYKKCCAHRHKKNNPCSIMSSTMWLDDKLNGIWGLQHKTFHEWLPYFPAHKTHFFSPEKCDLNSTCVLCAEGKYYSQNYEYPYIYYTTSFSWDSDICFQIMRSVISAC